MYLAGLKGCGKVFIAQGARACRQDENHLSMSNGLSTTGYALPCGLLFLHCLDLLEHI